ncbi:hypothetical protein GUITHDRAFT_142536 [Guillardia theta CCMP2712]|uniref:PH domain-containing protein n=1 Tax=Guillardia theta (strain CCMP2712) TaxID=905079 RepID=L1IY58_GUITC|nr:hypothetical protein GUITHDRAFT_142536 [Guillardia theta CCMP2712]EKX40760.1 hypothetical protein GUITHDRAFT_142536 [Guillardia theta CCMP2712]|eukprot:XP_005827740.1 hypothetical protein GUITHDRAFT_142536 [Guillardia theta CCMP2712]
MRLSHYHALTLILFLELKGSCIPTSDRSVFGEVGEGSWSALGLRQDQGGVSAQFSKLALRGGARSWILRSPQKTTLNLTSANELVQENVSFLSPNLSSTAILGNVSNASFSAQPYTSRSFSPSPPPDSRDLLRSPEQDSRSQSSPRSDVQEGSPARSHVPMADTLGENDTLRVTVVDPQEEHTGTIIWLHGMGHEAQDFVDGDLPCALDVPWCRFIFPHAPQPQEDQRKGGKSQEGRWFEGDLKFDHLGEVEGLQRSVTLVHRLIREQTSGKGGVPSKRICLVGFGHGGIVAMLAALTCRQQVGGLVVLSSWFPKFLAGLSDGFSIQGLTLSPTSRRTPTLVCHGLGDSIVPCKEGKEASMRLTSFGLNVEYKEYAFMAHDFCTPELVDVQRFLVQGVPRVERLLSLKHNPFTKYGFAMRQATWGIKKMKIWESRYLALVDNNLIGYGSEREFTSGKKPVEEWDLEVVRIAPCDKKRAGKSIEIVMEKDRRSFLLFDTMKERDEWLQALTSSQTWQNEEKERQRRVTIMESQMHLAAGREQVTSCLDWDMVRRLVKVVGSFPSLLSFTDRANREEDEDPPQRPVDWSYLDFLRRTVPSFRAPCIVSRIPQPVSSFLPVNVFAVNEQEESSSSSFHLWRSRKHRMSTPQWENLVFSGGGVKVLAFPPALAVIANCFGDQMCWEDIADETERATAILQTPSTLSRLLNDFGAVNGEILAQKVGHGKEVDEIIHRYTGLSGATFKQLYDHTGILLKIFATSLRSGDLIEFSASRTPNDQVAMAARCSMSVPFLFDAVWTKEGDRLVDGAVIDNCPVWCFDEDDNSTRSRSATLENQKTLAFWIATGRDPQQEQYKTDSRVLWVQAPEIPISTFRLDHAMQAKLYASGARSAREYLSRHLVPGSIMRSWLLPHMVTQGDDDTKAHRQKFKQDSALLARIKSFVRFWLTHRRRKLALLSPLNRQEVTVAEKTTISLQRM